MVDKVHPNKEDVSRPKLPAQDPPVPPPITYVIQVPKDQIYRVPPPENAKLQERYARHGRSLYSHHPCFCFLVLPVTVLVLLAVFMAMVLYLVFQPRYPAISVDSVSFSGLENITSGLENITSTTSQPTSPSVDLALTLSNDNRRLGIYYEGGDVAVNYEGVELGRGGAWPAMYQPKGTYRAVNVTVMENGVELSGEEESNLATSKNKGKIPVVIRVAAATKFKFGLVKTWRMKVKTRCDVIVDGLSLSVKVVNQKCHHGINIF